MVELQWNLYEAGTNRTLASVRLIEMSAKYRFVLHWSSCLLNTGCPLNMGYAKYRFHCSPAAYNFTWHKYNNYKHTWKAWFRKISIPFSRRVFRFEPPLFRKFHFNLKSLAFDTSPPPPRISSDHPRGGYGYFCGTTYVESHEHLFACAMNVFKKRATKQLFFDW